MGRIRQSIHKNESICFDTTQYILISNTFDNGYCLLYIGNNNKLTQPIGLSNYHFVFFGRHDLIELDLSDWDISKVESINIIFVDCMKLEKIVGTENWDRSKIKFLKNIKYKTFYLFSYSI